MTSAAERLSQLASTLEVGGALPVEQITGVTAIGVAGHTHVWNEIPAGVVDGAAAVMTLAAAPTPPESLLLFRNGLLLRAGAGNDFVLAGASVTFVQGNLCQPGDTVLASYTT